MATRFRMTAKGKKAFGVQILQSKRMQQYLRGYAQAVKARAEAIAPHDTGEYRSSFRIETSVRPAPPFKTSRAVATIGNDARNSLHVEYGGGRQFGGGRSPRHRTLGRALDSIKR